jgi:replicative DNA helicase
MSASEMTATTGAGSRANRERMVRWFCERLWSDIDGWVFVGHGYDPQLGANGKFEHGSWEDKSFAWPRQADQLIDHIVEAAEGSDVYVTPGLSSNPVRALDLKNPKHNRRPLPSRFLWSDLDGASPDDLFKLRRLAAAGSFTVASGRGDGHRHLYVALDETTDPDTVRALNRRLVVHVHGDPSPSALNGYLRPPGSYNWKPTVLVPGSAPVLVKVDTVTEGNGWSRADLDEMLPDVPVGEGSWSTAVAEPVNGDLPASIREILAEPADVKDRSGRHFALIQAAVRLSYSDGQVLTIVGEHQPSRAKFKHRLEAETRRALGKIRSPSSAGNGHVADRDEDGMDIQDRAEHTNGAHPNDGEDRRWDEPAPLSHTRTLPPFPVHVLPRWLAGYVAALAESTQTPVDLAAMLGLSALATVAGGRARVEVRPGWIEPLNIFTATALPSGSRKSAVFSDITVPLETLDADDVAYMKEVIVAADTVRKLAEAEADQALKAAGHAKGDDKLELDSDAIEAAKKAAAMAVPSMPRRLADDVTPEALGSLLADHGRISVLSDEGGIFAMMAGRYTKNSVPTLDVYLKGHAGTTLRVDRKGRDPEHVANPALTVGLAVQPEVLRNANQPAFRGCGLLARFLYSVPVNTVGRRKTAAPPVTPDISGAYRLEIRTLAQTLDTYAERAALTDAGPIILTLTPEAAAVIEAFETDLEPRLDPETGDLGHMNDWAGKLAGATMRIAGLLHLATHLRDGWADPIDAETVAGCVEVAHYLLAHAVAVFDLIGEDPDLEGARCVLRWIDRKRQPSFTRRDCFTDVRQGRFKTVDELDPALRVLEEHGYIRQREIPNRPGAKGGRPASPIFDVNPRILTA